LNGEEDRTMTKAKTLAKIHKLAASLEKEFNRDTYNECFTLANRFNAEHEDATREEICVAEIDEDYFTDYTEETGVLYNGISVEDEIYRWEKL
jgi:hypothetical protein